MEKILTYFFALTLGCYLAFSFELHRVHDAPDQNNTKCNFKFGDDTYWKKYSTVIYNKATSVNTITNPWLKVNFTDVMKKHPGHMIFFVCVNITNLSEEELNKTKVSYSPVFLTLYVDLRQVDEWRDNVIVTVIAKEKKIYVGNKTVT